MGQELRADGAAEGEIDGDGKQNRSDADGDVAMHNGRANRGAIVASEPVHDGVLPLLCALAEEQAGHDRSDEDGEDERAEQGKADRPGHGLEEPAFDGLQGEDGQIRGDDDAAGEEDRTLHFVRGIANLLRRGAGVVLLSEMADDVLDHHHGAIDHHAEVQRAERKQVGGNVAEVEADGGEQQREGNGERDDDGAAHVAEEEKENDRDQDHACGQVVLDGFDGVLHQLGAVEEGNDL